MVTTGGSPPVEVTSPPISAAAPVTLLAGVLVNAGRENASVVKLAVEGAQAEPPEFCAKARK